MNGTYCNFNMHLKAWKTNVRARNSKTCLIKTLQHYHIKKIKVECFLHSRNVWFVFFLNSNFNRESSGKTLRSPLFPLNSVLYVEWRKYTIRFIFQERDFFYSTEPLLKYWFTAPQIALDIKFNIHKNMISWMHQIVI